MEWWVVGGEGAGQGEHAALSMYGVFICLPLPPFRLAGTQRSYSAHRGRSLLVLLFVRV